MKMLSWLRFNLDHRVTDLYGQIDNLYSPNFIVCVCRHADLPRFLEYND